MERLTDLELLKAFVAVAELRHFGRAAERLHLAQPVVSRRIQRLEAIMKVSLLHRTSRQVTLTDAGTVFLDSARRLLHSTEVAVLQARRVAEGAAGRLSIGFVDSVAFRLLTPLLRELTARAPDLAVELRELSTEEQLIELDANVDVAVVREVSRPRRPPRPGANHRSVCCSPSMLPVAGQARVGTSWTGSSWSP